MGFPLGSTSIILHPRYSFCFYPISKATKPTIFSGGVAKQLILYLNSSQTFSYYRLTGVVVDVSRCAKIDPSTGSHVAFAVYARMTHFSRFSTFFCEASLQFFLIENTAEKLFVLLYTLSAVSITVNSFKINYT